MSALTKIKIQALVTSGVSYKILLIIIFLSCNVFQKQRDIAPARPVQVPNDDGTSRNYKLTVFKKEHNFIIYKRQTQVYRIDTVPLNHEDLQYIADYGNSEFIRIQLNGYFNKMFSTRIPGAKIAGVTGDTMVVYLPNGSIGTDLNDFKLNAWLGVRGVLKDHQFMLYSAELIPEDQFTTETGYELYKKEIFNRLEYIIRSGETP